MPTCSENPEVPFYTYNTYTGNYWCPLITILRRPCHKVASYSFSPLLSACIILRTTELLTGWGKMMLLLACHLWGDRLQLTGRMGRKTFSRVSYFTSSPYSSYSFSSTITLFLRGRPKTLRTDRRASVSPVKQKVDGYTKGLYVK